MADVSDDWDMAAARAKFATKIDTRKAARKDRQKRLNGAVDGRSLRATGRTEHLNFRASPQIVESLDKHWWADMASRAPTSKPTPGSWPFSSARLPQAVCSDTRSPSGCGVAVKRHPLLLAS